MPRIAILGAGLSGLTCAWQLLRNDPSLDVSLFEASPRTGGNIATLHEQGFTIELGPDSWVTEKPAARELVTDLGLADQLIDSDDSNRITHILLHGRLEALPSTLRMMVPRGPEAIDSLPSNHLFTPAVLQAFRSEFERAAELRRTSPTEDESIASFTRRHFGQQVLDRLAAPLLSGVFGGDVRQLSVRAVMAPFVAMERQHGSLIAALGQREAERRTIEQTAAPLFTSLRSGLSTLVEALTAALPSHVVHRNTRVHRITRSHDRWVVHTVTTDPRNVARTLHQEAFDHVILALPTRQTSQLLAALDPPAARLLPRHSSSAILVAFAWPDATFTPPPGFGLLVPPPRSSANRQSRLLAATFVDQKFPFRAPPGGRLLRTFFGTAEADRLMHRSDRAIAGLALRELDCILRPATGPLPAPAFAAISRWPDSLPQYAVGHLERTSQLERRLERHHPTLHLLGNALHGVGLSDLIRQARSLAHELTP